MDYDMFKRQREMEILSQVLMGLPKFSIITGPVDSGKTRLIEKPLQDVPRKSLHPMPVCAFNLRKGTYYTMGSLIIDSFLLDISSWLERVWEYMKSVGVKVEDVYGKSVLFQLSSRKSTSPTDSLNNMLSMHTANGLPQ